MGWSQIGFVVGVALLVVVFGRICLFYAEPQVAAILTVEITAVADKTVTARCLTNEYNDEQAERPQFRFLLRPHRSRLQVGSQYSFAVCWQSAGQELPQPGQVVELGETYTVLFPRHFWCYTANEVGSAGFALERPRLVKPVA